MCHDTAGPEKLILAVPGAYDFATPSGCGMLCRLKPDETSQPEIFGTLYFGIDKMRCNLIYHRFLSKQEMTESIGSVFKGPQLQDELQHADVEPASEEKEIHVPGKFEATIAKNGVIKFKYPTKGYSLFVHPIDNKRLPQNLFQT